MLKYSYQLPKKFKISKLYINITFLKFKLMCNLAINLLKVIKLEGSILNNGKGTNFWLCKKISHRESFA